MGQNAFLKNTALANINDPEGEDLTIFRNNASGCYEGVRRDDNNNNLIIIDKIACNSDDGTTTGGDPADADVDLGTPRGTPPANLTFLRLAIGENIDAGATLNINSSGDFPIQDIKGNAIGANVLNAGDTIQFQFSGGSYIFIGHFQNGGNVIRTQITIPTAEVLTLNTIPVDAAPARPNQYIKVHEGVLDIVFVAAAYAANTNLDISTVGATAPQITNPFILAAVANTWTNLVVGSNNTDLLQFVANAALRVSVPTGNPTLGDSDLIITIDFEYRARTI